MRVEIDKKSGFCFGVINAIKAAENELNTADSLYSLETLCTTERKLNVLKKWV